MVGRVSPSYWLVPGCRPAHAPRAEVAARPGGAAAGATAGRVVYVWVEWADAPARGPTDARGGWAARRSRRRLLARRHRQTVPDEVKFRFS